MEEDGEEDGGDVVEVLVVVPGAKAAVDADSGRPVIFTARLEVRSDLESEGGDQGGGDVWW